MWHLFNLSLSNCKYPLYWKQAQVCPIFKCGDQNEILNYSPIFILPTISKVFENILCNRIYCFIKSKIVNQQHGFLPKRSLCTNMLNFVQYVETYYSLGIQVDAIYLDFGKALDSVNHDRLLEKLHFFNPTHTWLASYLSNRIQYVQFCGYESRRFLVKSGVPQGTNLGPLMFLCYVNDITEYIKYSQILLFADDIKNFLPIVFSQSCELLRTDINEVNINK